MIVITKLKLDSRGRLTLPGSFLKANDIDWKTHIVEVKPKYNSTNEITLRFIKEGDDNGEQKP